MDFAAYPPEINSGRMYSGSGPAPILAAATAWDQVAAELHSAAASYTSVISDLIGGLWHGPSSTAMATAAVPFVEWMTTTAEQAEQSAIQARAAAAAYETAFAAHVPPPVIAANRSLLMSLIATNILGQNTVAIAATEAHYAEMWAQDAGAMYGYAASSAAATQLTPFTAPSKTLNPAAMVHAAVSVGSNAPTRLSQLITLVPHSLQNLATTAGSTPSISDVNSGLSSISSVLENLTGAYSPVGSLANTGTGWLTAMQITGLAQNGPGVASMLSGAPPITGALGPLSGGFISWQAPIPGPMGMGGGAVSAVLGQANLAGSLSVPASWAAVAPAAKTVAATLPSSILGVAPAIAADGQAGMFGEMALSSLAGRALAGSTTRSVVGTTVRVIDRAPSTEGIATTATILVIPALEE